MKLSRWSRRIPGAAKAAAAVAATWGGALGLQFVYQRLAAALYELARTGGWYRGHRVDAVLRDLVKDTASVLALPLHALIASVTVAVPLALLVRMVARARLRAGLPDPLDRAREWTTLHRRATRALSAIPAAAWVVGVLMQVWMVDRWHGWWWLDDLDGRHGEQVYAACLAGFTLAAVLASALVYKATKPALRAFLSPTVDLREKDETAPNSERRIGFDAVAVTAETRAAVAVMAALPVATFFAIQAANLGDTGTLLALAAYASTAVAGALAFRRASRIAVGVDGIFVTGSSRSRFFAYRDVDAVRANGSDIELLRGSRVVLRLQLHGEDATQKELIVARIEEAIDAARKRRTEAVGEIVASATPERLARLADGAEGYRSPSVTRDQLWSVVGAPEADAATRTAAARALVTRGDGHDRARLRVAASECAQPGVRVALMELADEDDEGDDEAAPGARRAGR